MTRFFKEFNGINSIIFYGFVIENEGLLGVLKEYSHRFEVVEFSYQFRYYGFINTSNGVYIQVAEDRNKEGEPLIIAGIGKNKELIHENLTTFKERLGILELDGPNEEILRRLSIKSKELIEIDINAHWNIAKKVSEEKQALNDLLSIRG